MKKFENVCEPNLCDLNCHTFLGNKLPIYENVGEERDQNVTNCYRFNFVYLQNGLFAQVIYD